MNWRTGMKVKQDPRRRKEADFLGSGDNNNLYSFGEGHLSQYDDEESSSESSPSSSSSCCYSCSSRDHHEYHGEENGMKEEEDEEVLVVAGCRSCLMYFMVPKLLQDCPKCFGQLLHFVGSQNAFS